MGQAKNFAAGASSPAGCDNDDRKTGHVKAGRREGRISTFVLQIFDRASAGALRSSDQHFEFLGGPVAALRPARVRLANR
jgi:hypothetical protein